MALKENALRAEILLHCRAMNASGLNQGTAGNISVRLGSAMLITPSAIPYAKMRPDMMAKMPLEGEYGAWSGTHRPSSEWRFHIDILKARPDVGAIVHCHPTYGTALAMQRRPIPAAHYMIALFGGPEVRCTPYAPYGTQALSDLALEGLKDRFAVLLGNHGAIALGATLESAMMRALELEALAKMYCVALACGKPAILPDDEIMRTVERFKAYGGGEDAPAMKSARFGAGRAKASAKPAVGKKQASPRH